MALCSSLPLSGISALQGKKGINPSIIPPLYSFRGKRPVYFIERVNVRLFSPEEIDNISRMNFRRTVRHTMNWDRVEGEWKQRRGKAVHHWGKLMNDELAAIAGRYEELVGRLQEKFGIAREEAAEKAARYKDTVDQLKKSNGKLIELQRAMTKKEALVGVKGGKLVKAGNSRLRAKKAAHRKRKRD